ncbi:GNAT family N-acetyltransferase [Vibrio renipiscarius]|uniref:GNAT family acetyltransferase n=1 Tax=Vibrio renipiscarius TaxID=1461322 RepID=A0A0C2K183_9VIBR|nr:GNAT family protein [Vibrio renipiscarius]KII75673.1 GNAT family acetyltransferase [Vibrio renipiscarius]KII81877.1 GNAT family acetyltransferase [Vibrio renipiscarius]
MTNSKQNLYNTLKKGHAIPFGETLHIALVQPNDLADIIEMLNDDKVNQYLFFAPADNSLYEGFFGPIIEGTQQAIQDGVWPDAPTFVLRDKQGQYMGMTAVTPVMFLAGNYEVGYQLPFHAWGQGIATRACQMMTDIGFTELNAHKISADCYASNIGSYKTMEKCGYVLEGRQLDYFKTELGFDDKVYYGITAKQYNALSLDA